MHAPILMKQIPPQIVNERAAFGPFDLKEFIQVPEGGESAQFRAELKSGEPLPTGLICTQDGILTGIPAQGTSENYEIMVTAENETGSVLAEFVLTIKPSMQSAGSEYMDQLKAQVWSALQQNLPAPDLQEMYGREITPLEIYYLLERWGTLTIWDAFNLESPGEKHAMQVQGISPHYLAYDRGSCLVICPKELFSHERTLEDGIRSARALAKEAYNRGWTVQLVGFEKLTRAAWVEIQHLGDKLGKRIEVIGYQPTLEDVKIYKNEAESARPD